MARLAYMEDGFEAGVSFALPFLESITKNGVSFGTSVH